MGYDWVQYLSQHAHKRTDLLEQHSRILSAIISSMEDDKNVLP